MIINPVQYNLGTKLPELTNPGTAADLLAGKQLVDQYGNPLTGTMPKRSASDLTASGATVTVPAGYYPSQVSKSVATATHPKPTLSRSGGTVTASHVQSAGYTSGGTTTETLTIPTQAGKTVTPTTAQQTAVASGRLTTGAVYVAGDANLKAENIKSGVSIFGISGTYSGENEGNLNVYWRTGANKRTITYYYFNRSNERITGELTALQSSVDIPLPLNGLVIVIDDGKFGSISDWGTNTYFGNGMMIYQLRGDRGSIGLS